MTVMATELGYYSQNVAPDYGKITYNYMDWASPSFIARLFDEGNELVIRGHVGTGKTHLAVQFMADALAATSPQFVVITNVSGIEDKSGQHQGSLHHVSLLSEVLRIWTDLPEDTRILLVLDEPESNLRGGNTKSVNAYQDFRYMIRKLGIAKIEIWHSESEQYKGLREDKSEKVYRILKDQKDAFSFTRRIRDQIIKQRVENVPKECGLGFATRGMTTIDIDVDMGALLRRIGKLWRLDEIKAAVREALEDPRIYQAEYRSEEAKQQAEAVKQADQERREQDVVRQVLADPTRFLAASKDGFDPATIRRAFGLTFRDADRLARLAWAKHKPTSAGREEAIIRDLLARPEEFYSKQKRCFDPVKLRAAFGITHDLSRELAKRAWERRGAGA
jgi:hypothetical protein